MKNTAILVITAIFFTFITLFSGCNKSKNDPFTKEQLDKFWQNHLVENYIGERENGSKVYIMQEHEHGRSYLIRKIDGSYKQAFAFGKIPEEKILEGYQNKCLEIYKDPNDTSKDAKFLDQLEKMINDSDDSDCWPLMF